MLVSYNFLTSWGHMLRYRLAIAIARNSKFETCFKILKSESTLIRAMSGFEERARRPFSSNRHPLARVVLSSFR